MTPSEAPGGYGKLARQIADWTTKGLFSALVLVAGLGFGRQVIRWWHDDDPPPAATEPATTPFDLSDAGDPMEIALGDLPYRLGRQTVIGDQAEAMQALRAACRRLLPSASPWSPVADEDEQKLLARLAELGPAGDARTSNGDSQAGERLYEPAPGMPLVIGTRRVSAGDGPLHAIAQENRVVLWGLAVPADERWWTLCLFHADRRGSDEEPGTQIPLPPDCQRLMALRRGGAELSAFQGGGPCDEYRRFYAAWQVKHRPHDAVRWQRADDGGWYASMVRRGPDAAAGSARSMVIQLVPGRPGGCTGLVLVSP
ncbi:MAG TPA: hypothetical protein VNH11_03725 [Pirellulales bacterium]|nr:hypothetical protein [Pirellulales bacterium]